MASCSHWWHAPVYFVASVVLAFIAISTALNSPSSNAARPTRPISNYLSLNASRTLRESGFNIMATLLLLSPEMFFLSPNIIIFAIKDSSPSSSCFPTLVGQKNLAVTRIHEKERLLEINHVLPIQAPICDAISNLVSDADDPKIIVEWTRIIHLLSSHRIVLFAIGLNSVINRILADHKSLSSVTIFAPSEFEFVASSSPMLEKIVKFHMLPLRVTYIELAALPHKQRLMTLLPCEDLEIINGANVIQGLSINRVEIAASSYQGSSWFMRFLKLSRWLNFLIHQDSG
uniref:FAS1 domain-containing protein n=1 Tax=Populus alba TaxID=43335 RepID=A0A4U5R345_POPAL|nr:hypothetical protein D5086_0000023340 [Populus alba]